MTDEREVFLKGLVALGAVQQGGARGQLAALRELKLLVKEKIAEVGNLARVESAQENANERISKGHPRWGVHMTHCYGLNYDDHWGDGKPTERYSCKYGEDHICPAALYPDPWAEWCKHEEEEKANNPG